MDSNRCTNDVVQTHFAFSCRPDLSLWKGAIISFWTFNRNEPRKTLQSSLQVISSMPSCVTICDQQTLRYVYLPRYAIRMLALKFSFAADLE